MKKEVLFCLIVSFAGVIHSHDVNFKNRSIRPIHLEIPTVMNPNLQPLSSSTAGLPIGQEIYFTFKGKRELLLVIERDTPYDLVINKIVRQRKKELRNEE